jgi:hypothetical protein
MEDAINIFTPLCHHPDCRRLAIAFICWPQTSDTETSSWTTRCDQHVPWHDPDAVAVGIRHLSTADYNGTASHSARTDPARGDGAVGDDPDPRPPTHPTTSP